MTRNLIIAAAVLASTGAGATELYEDVHLFRLDNGLQGVVIEDHRAPVVTQMVWYRVGGADDPPGQSGLSHFLEHLMFKGTDSMAAGAFSRIVAENGGEGNAFTAPDYTAYFQRIASDRLELVMEMEADRMVNLAPDPATVRAERDVVMEERRQVVDSSPQGPFGEARRAALYLNHPYGRPIIGWPDEIAGFDLPAAMAHYRRHYAPDNAILVVAGDADADVVEALARAHFGPIPAAGVVPRTRPQEPAHTAARRVEMHDPRVREPVLARSYLAPPRRSGAQAEAAALKVLAAVLGGSDTTSMMARDLQIGDAIALRTGAGYGGTTLDATRFELYLVPRAGVAPAEAEAALDATIARVIAEGPDPTQLDRIKTRLRAGEVFALDNLQGRARQIGAVLSTGLTLEDLRAWPETLQAVTPEDVQAAALAVFRPEASVTAWLLPEPPAAEVSQ